MCLRQEDPSAHGCGMPERRRVMEEPRPTGEDRGRAVPWRGEGGPSRGRCRQVWVWRKVQEL